MTAVLVGDTFIRFPAGVKAARLTAAVIYRLPLPSQTFTLFQSREEGGTANISSWVHYTSYRLSAIPIKLKIYFHCEVKIGVPEKSL